MKIPKVRRVISRLFSNLNIINLTKNYKIVDIHFFSSIYDDLIDSFLYQGNKVKLTIWGSDFYRTNDERKEKQREIYRKVDSIHICTLQMKNDFLNVFPECEDKIRLAQFGVAQFDIIEKLQLKEEPTLYKKELKIPEDKIIIACGANGSEGHQHAIIFESIQKLPVELKNKLFLVVLMTYGGTSKYLNNTKEKLTQLGLPFKQFVTSLSMQDICKLKIVSDINITIQKTDAFSAAIQEQIYAGGVLIIGEWLPYSKLTDNGIYYKPTSLDKLTETIGDTITNLQDYKRKCYFNKSKIEKIASWKSTIKDWEKIYKELNS
jgi:glycosyltransferase involved in cell wall biosynthesis